MVEKGTGTECHTQKHLNYKTASMEYNKTVGKS